MEKILKYLKYLEQYDLEEEDCENLSILVDSYLQNAEITKAA